MHLDISPAGMPLTCRQHLLRRENSPLLAKKRKGPLGPDEDRRSMVARTTSIGPRQHESGTRRVPTFRPSLTPYK